MTSTFTRIVCWVWLRSDIGCGCKIEQVADAAGGVVFDDSHAPKFVMPSIYRPKNEKVFRAKIGYVKGKTGKRERREFRLGNDELHAHKLALALGEKWLREEQRHYKNMRQLAEVGVGIEELPIWTGWDEAITAGNAEYHSVPPETLREDNDERNDAAAPQTPVTLRQASEELLGRLLAKAERDAKAFATYRWYEREFKLGLVANAISGDFPADKIKLSNIEQYCNFWCDTRNRALESKHRKFGYRSAWNRLDALAFLLRDLKGRVEGYVYPERADETFEEAKATVAGSLTEIYVYNPERLKLILANSDDFIRMLIYLALNFGMYQADIGQQIFRRYDEEKGGVIEIGGDTHLQWERHKLLRRQRAKKRDTDDKTKPVLLTHYVWPETMSLLNRFAAPERNEANLWLLNRNGLALWRQEPHHKRPCDNLSTKYYRVLKKLKVRLPFEQLRKFGATDAAKITPEIQELFRGERRQGSSVVYVLDDYVGKLTPFLKTWADQLRADGVLF